MSLVYWTGRLKTTSDVLLTSITQNVTTGTSGTHTDLSTTTNGEGSGAVLTVTISSGSIVSVTVTDSGKRYNAGDTLTVNSIPGSTQSAVFTLQSDDMQESLPPVPSLWSSSVGSDGLLQFNVWSGYYETTPDANGNLIPDVSKPVRELIVSLSAPNMTQDIKDLYT